MRAQDRIGGNAGKWLFLVFACPWLVMGLGCQDSKSPPEENPPEAKAPETVEPTTLQDGNPGTPEAAMRQMVEGLRANRPVVIWRAMPKPFQREINGLVREFARKMDPELWRQSFVLGEKLARLLDEKKSEILSHPELAKLSPEERRRLEQHWEGLLDLLTILVHSEVADLAQLESFEMGRFLEKTGGRWLAQLAALSESSGQDSLSGMLAGLKPKTLSIKDDKAIMGWMTEESTEPVSRFAMIKVEDRWVPAGWVPAWERVREWRGLLRQMPAESFRQQSAEKIPRLAQAERTVDALLATKTPPEFHETLANELGEATVEELAALVRMLSGAAPAAPEVVEPPPPTGEIPKTSSDASSVTLMVSGAADTEDEDRIFDVLQSALPGDVDVQFHRSQTGLKVIVGPVANWGEFRKRLTFGTITQADEKLRVFHLDMKR